MVKEWIINQTDNEWLLDGFPRNINQAESLTNILSSEIDTLILGCTHYPLFKNIISQIINPNILIIDSAKETAKCVQQHLSKKQLLSKENQLRDKYYVSDKPEQFDQLANMFLGIKDINVNHIRL